MNIFITGGAGFIGSHIAKRHLKKGDQVWVVDNISSGNKSNLPVDPLLQFEQEDICNYSRLPEAVAWSDRIYHMAAYVGQKLVLAHPTDTISMNIQSLDLILKAMSQVKKDIRLLIASSSGVYIHGAVDAPLTETAMLSIPSGECLQETYRLSKIVNEVMGLAYVQEKKIHCTIARIFNTIGVNQTGRYGMVVPTFIQQALKGEPITVYGNGLQSRSFCNVHDVVEAFDLLLQTPRSKGEIVNVGNDSEYTILDLAKLIREKARSQSEIRFIPYQEAYGVDFIDVQSRKPNLSRLFSLTGFKPKWSLEQTIDELLSTHYTDPS